MRKHKLEKATSLALILSVFLAACNNAGSETGNSAGGGSAAGSTTTAEKKVALHQDPKEYTFNDRLGAEPTNWNPHTWEMNADSYIMGFITTPLVDVAPNGEGGFERTYEGATAVTDVTEKYRGSKEWNIPEDAENMVYQIDLREGQTFDDGSPINADTHVYGMQQLLDPEMKNYRANNYIEGDLSIQGAFDYYNSDKAGQTKYTAWTSETPEDAKLFVKSDINTTMFGKSLEEVYESNPEYFTVEGEDLSKKYNTGEAIPVDSNVEADLKAWAALLDTEENWREFTVVEDGVYAEKDWSKVGFFKGDNDYQLIYVLNYPLSEFYFLNNMTAYWLVDKTKYEAGKKKVENLVATNYGTSVETSSSFGPYKITSFEPKKQIKLERNENWFGYKTDLYDDRYQTDHINIEIVPDNNTALQLFNQGKLDEVSLEATELEKYRMSDYLVSSPSTFTMRFVFGTSPETLTQLEKNAGDGSNKRVLQYADFRKAISLSIDRNKLATETTAGNEPALFLLNNLYYYDVENDPNSIYRKSEPAMRNIDELYGVEYGEGKEYKDAEEAYNSITGYDVEQAKELFQSVYEQAVKDGNYKDGQEVKINIMISAATSMSADDTRQQDMLNEFLAEATKGTGFEGKVKIVYQTGAPSRYTDVVQGKQEAILGAWGGAAFYPFSTIGVYVDPDSVGGKDSIHESNGWDPTVETLTLKYDFNGDGKEEELTKTLTEWHKSIDGGGEYSGNAEVSLEILAALERTVLESYQCIPLFTNTDNTLRSQKINYYTYEYNIMYGFGGFSRYTYNYDDAGWDAYVKQQGGTLNYE